MSISNAATAVKRSISPSLDSLPSNKKHTTDPDFTIEKELHHILNLFKQREKKKEELFNEWVKNGLNPHSLRSLTIQIFSLNPLTVFFRRLRIQLNGGHSVTAVMEQLRPDNFGVNGRHMSIKGISLQGSPSVV